MRIVATLGGEVVGEPRPPADVAGDAVSAEAAGFPAAWMTHMSRGVDALTVLAAAATRTTRIDLGVGVVPTYPRHPHALAQQAATVQSLAGGRLTLGVGVSHRPVIEGLFGLPYESPANHLREYLSVLVPLLRTGSVSHRGERYTVDGGFRVPGTSAVQVVVGALGRRMVDVAGRHADGVVTWLAGPRVLAEEIGPWVRSAAAEAGNGPPRIIAGIPAAVCTDESAGRAAAARAFVRYEGLTNYQQLLVRQGDARVGDLALVGDEEALVRQIDAFADAGVTDLWAIPFPIPGPRNEIDDAEGGVARTRALLAQLAIDSAPTGGGADG